MRYYQRINRDESTFPLLGDYTANNDWPAIPLQNNACNRAGDRKKVGAELMEFGLTPNKW